MFRDFGIFVDSKPVVTLDNRNISYWTKVMRIKRKKSRRSWKLPKW
jgi:hypothetical protein